MGILSTILQTLPALVGVDGDDGADGTTAVALVPAAQAPHLLAMLKSDGINGISVDVGREGAAPTRQARIVVLRQDAVAARASLDRIQQR